MEEYKSREMGEPPVLYQPIRIYMLKLIIVSVLASGMLSTIATRAQSPNPTVPTGLYSAHSVSLNTDIDRLKSPDGTKTLTVRRVEDDRD